VKPARKQLAYLKSLAEQTATTFTYSTTSAQASAEIRSLKTQPRSVAGERGRERRDVAHQAAHLRAPRGHIDSRQICGPETYLVRTRQRRSGIFRDLVLGHVVSRPPRRRGLALHIGDVPV
jgi:hypothetical protein